MPTATVHVVICSHDPETGQRLCRRLAAPGLEVRLFDAQRPEPPPHVIVVLREEAETDATCVVPRADGDTVLRTAPVPDGQTRQPAALATPPPDGESAACAVSQPLADTGASPAPPDEALVGERAGALPEAPAVVWLGDEARMAGPLEVHLPADVGSETLQVICRLLGRIVRLERRWRLEAESRVRFAAQAMRDPLTGLPNRRAWDRVLARRLLQADATQRLCLAIFDLDHFKQVNDTRGHPAGDQVLRIAGEALGRQLRRDDLVARLGGDEFGLLLWVPEESTAAQVIERVRRALPDALAQAGLDRVSASAGYCVVPAGEPGPQSSVVDAARSDSAQACPADVPFGASDIPPAADAPRANNALPSAGVPRSGDTLPSADALYEAADQAVRRAKEQGRDCSVAAAVG